MKKTISKKLLAVAKIARKTNEGSALESVLITPEKYVATNSHSLIEVKRTKDLSIDEFPELPGINTPCTSDELLLPADQIKGIKFNKSKNPTIPVLATCKIANETEDHVSIVSLDNDIRPTITLIQKSKLDYPDYKQVLPKEKPKASIKLDANLLKELCEAFIACEAQDFVLNIHEGDNTPLEIVSIDEEITAVLMPKK